MYVHLNSNVLNKLTTLTKQRITKYMSNDHPKPSNSSMETSGTKVGKFYGNGEYHVPKPD